jgi:hypothetical protein
MYVVMLSQSFHTALFECLYDSSYAPYIAVGSYTDLSRILVAPTDP